MPQEWLPLIPSGATLINSVWSVHKESEKWTYFCRSFPVFSHHADDLHSFRMFTAQMVCNGSCRQVELTRVFGVSKNSVSRSVKKFKEAGAESFFAHRKGRGPTVLVDDIKERAQHLLNLGESRQKVADQLGIKYDTLRKAIADGRLSEPAKADKQVASDKSERSFEDSLASMGMACTRTLDRVSAAIGALPAGAQTRFEACRDVSFGGVLCALPALITSGLLRHVDACFKSLKGYYTTLQIMILLAQMALLRIKSIEQLQGHSPGELGKWMGLDRIPEVRCLRNKLGELSEDEAPEKWSRMLSRDWMESRPQLAGALYVDGHVRVYHGEKTKLPRRFVSRERLCLRGTTDYWVNDALGQPFFVVSQAVDPGMLKALRTDIVPRLLEDVPGQPSDEELKFDPFLHRFVMIFDREGYSPAFFKEMWQAHRIACITYHKFPKAPWPEEHFVETKVEMPSGEILTLKLAEMGSWIGDVATHDAALIFSRWSQENFFRYMKIHYAIDMVSEYGTEGFPGEQQVVNPIYRELDRQRNSLNAKLTHRRARYAALELHPVSDEKKLTRWLHKKADLVEEIEQFEHNTKELKAKLKETAKHIDWHELEDGDKFKGLKPSQKHLVDTIKMIAYRAETAMVNIVREELTRHDDARALIRDLMSSDADILPDIEDGILNIRLHSMANQRSNHAIEHLLADLNNTEFCYPGIKMRMNFQMLHRHGKPEKT